MRMSLENLFCGFHGLYYIEESHTSVLILFSRDFLSIFGFQVITKVKMN